MPILEFYYDLSSPYSYLAATRVEQVAREAGLELVPRPFVLGAVFKAVGNQPPALIPAKAAWMISDLARWARLYEVPFRMPDTFPINAMKGHRMILAAGDAGWKLALALYRAYWADNRDITSEEVLLEVASGLGLDGEKLLAATEDPEIKQRLRAYTEEAVSRGAFGAPTFFVGGEMFYGNDRLQFVEQAARQSRQAG